MGRPFLFPVHICPCPVLSVIVSQLFHPRNYVQMCGHNDLTSALETHDNQWLKNSPVVITNSVGSLVRKLCAMWTSELGITRFAGVTLVVISLGGLKLVRGRCDVDYYTPTSPKWCKFVSQGFPQNPCMHLSSPPHIPHAEPISFIWFDQSKIFVEENQIIKLRTVLSPPVPC